MIGPLLAIPATALVMAWLGALFDLTIVCWLSVRRTRPYAFATLVGFHTITWLLFPAIGVFPLLMTISATVFFEPAWPRRFLSAPAPATSEPRFSMGRLGVGVVALYLGLMVMLPLRHHLIPGDVKWTGEGYLGSWQVMLTEKSASTTFLVTDPDNGRTWTVPAPPVLTARQQAVLGTDPVMIMQTADLIASELGGVSVAADVDLSFNGRPSTQYTDPSVDLTSLSHRDPVREWLMAEPVD